MRDIIGNTTTTPVPCSDWNQTNETKPDYIKNKPTIPTLLADLIDDLEHRTVTDAEKESWNNKATTEYVDEKISAALQLLKDYVAQAIAEAKTSSDT